MLKYIDAGKKKISKAKYDKLSLRNKTQNGTLMNHGSKKGIQLPQIREIIETKRS
jgi:hypothetical protein